MADNTAAMVPTINKADAYKAYGGVFPALPYSSEDTQTTRPPYAAVYGASILTVPRRGWDSLTRQYLEAYASDPGSVRNLALGQWYSTIPLRMLWMMGDIHPMVSMARSVWLRIAFSDSTTQFIAESSRGNTSDVGTRAINALIDSLPLEVGGIAGLQNAIGEQVLFTGMACLECVPNPTLSSLQDLVTFDPTTVRFRDDGLGNRYVEQKQPTGWRTLNKENCLAIGFDASRDNPYGRPVFAAALSEAMTDTAIHQSMTDVLQAVAWPRLSVGFPFAEAAEFAIAHPEVCVGQKDDGSDLTPAEYAMAEMRRLSTLVQNMKADDVFMYPKDGMVSVLNGANGMSSLDPILQQKRMRMCQAVDTLPNLLGVTDGGTQGYSSVQWGVQAKKIESFRQFVNHLLCKAFNLHLRLKGISATVRAEAEPIRATDALADEQARTLRIANEQALVDAGYSDRSHASQKLTGSEPILSDAQHEARKQAQTDATTAQEATNANFQDQ